LSVIFYRLIVFDWRNNMKAVQMVRLTSARGVIERVVVGDHGDIITVCTTEEWKQAKKENRAPFVAGFKKSDIIRTE
jgi:hypothetical protein